MKFRNVLARGGGLGYAGGVAAGGAVTQTSTITTGVTLDKVCGQITTVASTLGAGLEATFTVTNAKVTAKDVVVLSTTYAGGGVAFIHNTKVAAGSFDITISNLHASAALDALLVINFIVLKGASN